ncbi:MAG: DMT family transporter [Candidatus Hermodarchaeota archaeon]
MKNFNLKKGIICGLIAVFLIGMQPVIANSRPSIIDPYIFAAITALIEALIFFPIFMLEIRRLNNNSKNNPSEENRINSLLYGWKKKKNIKLLIVIALIFSIVPILLYIGYELAGEINSSLALKSEIIFALLFGYLILKEERISKIQILFCFLLFVGLFIAITEGSFNLLEFNIGVVILLISVALFTFVHAFTKSAFDRNELFPTQVIFIRNLCSGIILTLVYLVVFPKENFLLLLDLDNFIFFMLMGLDYGFSLFFWYKTISYIQIGKAGIINSLTPIVTAFFSFIFLGGIFTIFHLIGTMIIILSIFMIIREKGK